MKEAYLAQKEFEVKELVLQHEMKEATDLTKKERRTCAFENSTLYKEASVEASDAYDALTKLLTAKLNASSIKP